jgi:hypothetical protein
MSPDEQKRFAKWVKRISDYRLVRTPEGLKVVGEGIDDLSEEELDAVYAKPCKYRRAARASRL